MAKNPSFAIGCLRLAIGNPVPLLFTLRMHAFTFPRRAGHIGLTAVALVFIDTHLALAEDPLPEVQRLQSSPVLRHLVPNPNLVKSGRAGEETVAQMHVPPGFQVDLIAGEPDLHQPVAFTFDERGRLWVVEAHSYPTKRPEGEGLDKIVIFADENGDGDFESRRVFAEGLNLVSGMEVGHGGVWVGAAPQLLFIPDRDRDDRSDGPPEVLLDGFGFQDTHETLNSFLWGPDGWLYGIQGVFNHARIGPPGSSLEKRAELRAGVWRYHPVRHEFEIFAHGGSNPWGLDYDEHGEIFMTHCRSYWGRGPTTHVIQNGHFWNQANAHYAPSIVANPPREFPGFRKYLLASARYGHGAGGAGPRGSDVIYGGHSHVGTMIYYGDNWPDEYRGHLFTHNLGGHQINRQINERLGSGYNTVHAGRDQLFCSDPQYVAVDLQYGPDGAVYMIDWVDLQHCHNPNTERWDRGNGRIYRLQYADTFRPVKVDLSRRTDLELVELLGHKNHWYGRTARRLLHERAQTSEGVDAEAVDQLRSLARGGESVAQRLGAMWSLHLTGSFGRGEARRALRDENEFVRAWAVQLTTDNGQVSARLSRRFSRLAREDDSPLVRRFLASALPRLREQTAWDVAEALAAHGEDREDRNLPYLLWQGLAERMPGDVPRALALVESSEVPQLADWAHWYAATLGDGALNSTVASLEELTGENLERRLAGLWLAMEPRVQVPMPQAWPGIAPALYEHADVAIQRRAERLASVFGDESAFPRLRDLLSDRTAGTEARRHAFDVLSRAQDRPSLEIFLQLLDDPAFRSSVIPVLARFADPRVADALLRTFDGMNSSEQATTLNALTRRASMARTLLEAVAQGAIDLSRLNAYHIRQMSGLNDQEVQRRIAELWGEIQRTPAEKQERIEKMEKVYSEAPLWAYSAGEGRKHFEMLCAQCHRLGDLGARLGPELTGAGKHGVRYYLENIIDPNAVVGLNFQATTVETWDDEVLTGLVVEETPSAIMLRTTVGDTVVAKNRIQERVTSENSLMPEGLLESLPDRQQLELLKFLVTN